MGKEPASQLLLSWAARRPSHGSGSERAAEPSQLATGEDKGKKKAVFLGEENEEGSDEGSQKQDSEGNFVDSGAEDGDKPALKPNASQKSILKGAGNNQTMSLNQSAISQRYFYLMIFLTCT